MIDVDPPHASIETWRDILIHLAIIVTGILIAIGLEQTAEAIHHRHQCRDLEANMRAEAQHNVGILNIHLDVNIPNMLWYRSALTAVRTATPHAAFVDVTLPPPFPHPKEAMIAPARNVWPAAEAAGTVILLSDKVAQVYAVLDHQWVDDDREVEHIRDATALITRFELATGEKVSPGATLHLTVAQQEQLVTALATEAQSLFDLLHRDNLFLLVCQAVAQGIDDPATLSDFIARGNMRINNYR